MSLPVKIIKKYKRKEHIPATVRNYIWNIHVSKTQSSGICYCCNVEIISKANFHAGHIIAEANGGPVHVDNLRPICALCNSSMGKMNMLDFMVKYGLNNKPVSNVKSWMWKIFGY
jgi:hypothetical protein